MRSTRSIAGASRELLLRALEQPVAPVVARVDDDLVEEIRQHASEPRPLAVAELEEVGAVDGEVGQTVRTPRLLLEQCTQSPDTFELVVADVLRAQVGLLVVDEVICQLVSVLAQEPPREERVDV